MYTLEPLFTCKIILPYTKGLQDNLKLRKVVFEKGTFWSVVLHEEDSPEYMVSAPSP